MVIYMSIYGKSMPTICQQAVDKAVDKSVFCDAKYGVTSLKRGKQRMPYRSLATFPPPPPRGGTEPLGQTVSPKFACCFWLVFRV